MRLYRAICAWLEATAFEKLANAGAEEPHPEGNNFAHVEHAHSFTTEPELHAGYRPEHMAEVWEDRGRISLRWHPSPPGLPPVVK
jgi:hypothetical protein